MLAQPDRDLLRMALIVLIFVFPFLLLWFVRRRNAKSTHSLYHSLLNTRVPFMVNCRDVGGLDCITKSLDGGRALGRVRSGFLLRSAWPAWCGASEFIDFVNRNNVQLIVDLRSSDERHETYPWEMHIASGFPAAHACAPPYDVPARLHVPLLPREAVKSFLVPQLTLGTKLQFVMHKIVNSPDYRAWGPLMRQFNVSREGLGAVYTMFLESSGPEIASIFRTLLWCAEQGHAVLLHCMVGKDRTGVVAALLLLVLGVPEEQVVADYARTEEHFQQVPQILHTLVKNACRMFGSTLGTIFLSAHHSAMRNFIRYLNTKWLGAEHLLNSLGFTYDEQFRLQRLLTDPAV